MNWRIGELLIQKKLISWEQLQDALETQKVTKAFTGDILVDKGYVSQSLLFKTLADQHRMRFIDLERTFVNPKAVTLIPGSIAHKYNVVAIEKTTDAIIVGVSSPVQLWPQQEIQQMTKIDKIETVLCLPKHIASVLEEYYPVTGSDSPSPQS